MVATQWDTLWPHLSSGALDPVIHSVLPLERAQEALELIDSRSVRGKVVLEVRGETGGAGIHDRRA